MASTHLKRTSLYDVHRAAGARMVEFGDWEMPVQYAGIVEEHHAVRTAAGLFDVSHMGEVEVFGPGALESVQRLITNDAARLIPGQGLYSPVCLPSGGIIDDLTVFRLTGDRFLFVVNASRTERDFQWIAEHTRAATARDRSADLALLALQGPKAQSILERLTRADLTRLASFHFTDGLEVAGLRCLVARTGYTGEGGLEIACAWDAAPCRPPTRVRVAGGGPAYRAGDQRYLRTVDPQEHRHGVCRAGLCSPRHPTAGGDSRPAGGRPGREVTVLQEELKS